MKHFRTTFYLTDGKSINLLLSTGPQPCDSHDVPALLALIKGYNDYSRAYENADLFWDETQRAAVLELGQSDGSTVYLEVKAPDLKSLADLHRVSADAASIDAWCRAPSKKDKPGKKSRDR